jgi:hypothetical protein
MRIFAVIPLVLAVLAVACHDEPAESVTPVPLPTLRVSPRTLMLLVPQEFRLSATVDPAVVANALRWASSAPGVVSVSNSGVACARQQGTVTVRVWLAAHPSVRDSMMITTADIGQRGGCELRGS